MRALDPTHLGGCEIKVNDPLWRSARELEYQEAVSLLAESKYALIVINICVYNERPVFLHRPPNGQWEENKLAAGAERDHDYLWRIHVLVVTTRPLVSVRKRVSPRAESWPLYGPSM